MVTETRTVTIPHLGRVEGHGGIHVRLSGDTVSAVEMDIHEGSRYYEALLVGRGFLEVQGIITRVCAICSADHTVAALEALEDALGVQVSDRTRLLRGLMLRGAAVESHALHVFALALPDFLGYGSVMEMAGTLPTEVTSALRLKQLGNQIQTLVGGRAVHPVNAVVGGFGSLPAHQDLERLREELTVGLQSALEFVELARSVAIPTWATGERVYVALKPARGDYGFRGTSICTSSGDEFPIAEYRRVAREYSVGHSHAKHATLESGESFMVGALARLHLWGDHLQGRARQAYEALFPEGPSENVLFNNWAQLVEIVHALETAIEICGALIAMDEIAFETADYEVRAGRGIAAVEVPRGTLFHEFELDDAGVVVAANVVTPTSQNLANTELDLRRAAQCLLGSDAGGDIELKLGLEMVVRAYDPCISCSVHVIRADF